MDPYDLERFRQAQAGVFAAACAELRAGRKRTHWMWFVFPQLRGLGASAMAQTYGIASRAEAQAYLTDPVLGPRLRQAFGLALSHEGAAAREIFGAPDDVKFRSCATLFSALPDAPPEFARAIERFFDGVPDARTLALLAELATAPGRC